MKHKASKLSWLGTGMIMLSLAGFAVFFYPIAQIYLFPPTLSPVEDKGVFITIPKIHAESPVILNIDPWNEQVYKEALTKGVAHAKGTVAPGEKGTSFLFAHSSGNPWELTRSNTIFLRLPELEVSDIIVLTVDGKRTRYAVSDKKEVDPSEVEYLLSGTKNQLILQTCTPIGTSLRRLLIFATPVA